MAQDFYRVHADCLPLFAKRLRRKFSSAAEFARRAPPLLEKWALSAVLAIDPSERSHAQLRRVVASPALGKSMPLPQSSWSASRCVQLICSAEGRMLAAVHAIMVAPMCTATPID